MLRIPCRSGSALAIVCLVLATGCGNDDDDAPRASPPSSSTAESGSEGEPPDQRPVPYLALDAPGWTLTGGAAVTRTGELPLGALWRTTYVSRPEPNRSVSAALMITELSTDANELARQVGSRPTQVTVNGVPAVAVEEHGSAGGHLVATHVLWDLEGFVVALTVYETGSADAVALAQNVKPVTEADWRTAVERANAES